MRCHACMSKPTDRVLDRMNVLSSTIGQLNRCGEVQDWISSKGSRLRLLELATPGYRRANHLIHGPSWAIRSGTPRLWSVS